MRLHVVDGTYELFRAHFSQRPPHAGPGGRDLKATMGVASSMLALLAQADEAVTHLAIAFDNPIRSFRNDLFPSYKSDEGVPPELRSQFDDVEAAMRALGITVWSMREFEADDALATAAARWRDEVDQVRIMTPDKDLGQCLRGMRVVQVDRRREKVLDEASFLADRGFACTSIPDFLALVGDTADGIPGLDGFGERTAALLLGRFPHLEDIPADAAKWPPGIRGAPRLAQTLGAGHEDALLYRKLATVVETVPLPQALDELRWRGIPRELFEGWTEAVGAPSWRLRTLPSPR